MAQFSTQNNCKVYVEKSGILKDSSHDFAGELKFKVEQF
jgi:hypothetical protein